MLKIKSVTILIKNLMIRIHWFPDLIQIFYSYILLGVLFTGLVLHDKIASKGKYNRMVFFYLFSNKFSLIMDKFSNERIYLLLC